MVDHPADRAGREVAKSLKLGFYWVFFHFWRKGWDSNPRYPCGHAGFQDRCLKPLGHPSNEEFRSLIAHGS